MADLSLGWIDSQATNGGWKGETTSNSTRFVGCYGSSRPVMACIQFTTPWTESYQYISGIDFYVCLSDNKSFNMRWAITTWKNTGTYQGKFGAVSDSNALAAGVVATPGTAYGRAHISTSARLSSSTTYYLMLWPEVGTSSTVTSLYRTSNGQYTGGTADVSTKTYTVSYYLNGGFGQYGQFRTQTVTYNGYVDIYGYSPQKSGQQGQSGGFYITGDANGGSVGSSVYASWADAITYSFGGWSCSNGYSYSAGGRIYNITSNISLTAKWSSNTTRLYSNNTVSGLSTPSRSNGTNGYYTISFNANGGNSTPSAKYAYKRVRYDFAGWYTDPSGGSKYSSSDQITSERTVYAHWTPIAIGTDSVDLSSISKNNTSFDRIVEYKNRYGSPERTSDTSTVTTSYSFKGWKKPDGNILTESSFTPNANMTLIAQWNTSTSQTSIYLPTSSGKPNSVSYYTVTLNSNGGNSPPSSKLTATRTISYGFSGWSASSSSSSVVSNPYKPASNGTTYLYDVWYTSNDNTTPVVFPNATRNPYNEYRKVNFHARSGSVSPISKSSRIETTYDFEGWTMPGVYGSYMYNDQYTPTGDITATAQWSANSPIHHGIQVPDATGKPDNVETFTVTLDPNGGQVLGGSGKLTAEKRIKYQFIGWSLDPNSSEALIDSGNFQPSKNEEDIYDVWDVLSNETQAVKFPDANKDSIYEYRNISLIAREGSVHPTTAQSNIETSYTLQYWNIPNVGNYYSGGEYTPTGNVTATAQWNKHGPTHNGAKLPEASGKSDFSEAFAVTINSNGGNDPSNPSPKATRVVTYRFKGWSESMTSSAIVNSQNYQPKSDGVKLYDVWEVATDETSSVILPTITRDSVFEYKKVTLNSRHGTVTPKQLTSTIETAYDFNGWNIPGGGVQDPGYAYIPSGNIEITAQWYERDPVQSSVSLPNATDRANDEIIYTVTLDPNGGNPVKNNKLESTRTKTYSFVGWTESSVEDESIDKDILPKDYTPLTNITLYDVWKVATDNTTPVKLPVTSKNAVVDASFKVTINYASKPTEVNTVNTISNYGFIGWWKNKSISEYEEPIIGTYTPKGNITLYALYSRATDVGTIELVQDTKDPLLEVYDINLNATPAIVDPDHYTRTNKEIYKFLGWNDGLTEEKHIGTYTPTRSVTLNPIWDITKTPPEPINLPIPKSPGRDFLGWQEIDGGDVENPTTYIPTRSTTLIAIWKVNGCIRINGRAYEVWIYSKILGVLNWRQYVPYVFHHTDDGRPDWKAGK